MTGKRNTAELLFLAITVSGGAALSIVLAYKFVNGDTMTCFLAAVLGVIFTGLGWLLAENMGEAVILLFYTTALGAVVLVYIQSDVFRVVMIAFLCGYNIGKLAGGIYRES